PQEEDDSLSSPEATSNTEEGLQAMEAWIQARRQLRSELESLGDVEKWLAHKPALSYQEAARWQSIRARRAERKAAVKPAMTQSPDRSAPKSSQPCRKGGVPLVCAPYPQALVRLHNLLHEQKLTMVNVFKKAGMDGRKIKRADFIRVIREVQVPISDKDLEDVVIFLTSSKPGNFISPQDLMNCQKQWLEMRKGQPQETQTGVEDHLQKATCKTATCPPSAGGTAKRMKPHAPTMPERTLTCLEVPPVNTEPERRHLSCDEMEEIGKVTRERRRWEKNKDGPIERKEKCRMVRSGDGPVDEHCLPSTVEADLGELVNRYRRDAVTTYLKSSELCKERGVPITEPTLQKALLHPGDKIIKEGEEVRKIRQPGGYYSPGRADGLSPGSTSRSGAASGSHAKEAKPSEAAQNFISVKHAILSYVFFFFPFFRRHLVRNQMQKSSDNNFWPGHLLDKLCLYFPEKQHDRAHALFSCV
ncbi:EF-hand calcium-binding domain-containing protein 12, partial [Egretta garzetta]